MNGKGILFIALAIVVFCVAGLGIFGNMAAPQKTTGTVQMVQPCGWFWCADYDSQYSETNKNNSQANQNNGEANLYNAQAKQVESRTVIVQQQLVGYGLLMGVCGAGLLVLVVVIVVMPVLGRMGGG